MDMFTQHQGIVVPIDRANIDTDAIIPKQYLKSVNRTGFGVNLFDDWRYNELGEPGMDHSKRTLNTDFVLNQPRYANSTILLAQENFGCGSSREHAVWALTDYGIRAIIAPSFADIFFNNSFKNGLLPITLKQTLIDDLFTQVTKNKGYQLMIDLHAKVITQPNGVSHSFDIDEFRRYCLLNGLDDIGITLKHADEIKAYEIQRKATTPWLFE